MQSPNTQLQTPPKPQTPSQSKVYVLPSTEELSNILFKLSQTPRASVFEISPPSTSSSGQPDVSQRPTDLGAVKKRLDSKQYTKTEDALADIQFIFQTAMKNYPKENTIHQSAIETANHFQQMVKTVIGQKTSAYQMALQRPTTPVATGRPNTPQIVSPSRFPLPPGYQYVSSNPLALLPLKDKVTKMLDSLETLKDSEGRQIAELFIDVPDRDQYPDYYVFIQNPIAFSDMRKKNYTGARQFISDFVLLVNNAQTYNLSNSFIYNDSRLLYNHFQREAMKYFPGENIPLSKDAQLRAAKKQKKGRGKKKTKKEDDYGSESEESDEFDLEDDDLPDLGTPQGGKRKIDGFEIDDEVRRSKRPKATPTKEVPPEELELDEEIEQMDVESAQNSKFLKEPTIEDQEQKEKKAIVEKILGDRPKVKEDQTPTEEFEYYVKWKGKSYIHCEWIDQSVILGESHGKTKVNRYHQSKISKAASPNEDEQEYFPEEFCEVERVIASKETLNKKTNKTETKYLVKWKGIGYSECTWEWPEDFKDDEKVAEFKKFNTPPIVADSKAHIKKKWIKLEASPKYKNDNVLRPYQLEGMNWLTFCWHEGRGSILADEMGLGKTVQSIALLNYLKTQEGIRGPYLVVAPLSTLGHWYREIEEWTEMNVVMYQGNKHNREVARQYEWYYLDSKGEAINTTVLKFNVLLTTYEMILSSDWQDIAKINWKVIVVDEAQRLKNQNSKLLENLRLFKSDHRVLLTGTPLQNNTQELWSLLNYIEPNKFSQSKDFMVSFGQLENAEQVRKLHDILRPHLLRRLKEDVEKSIPPKEETLIEVELTSIQKQYYKAVLEKNRDFLNKGTVGKNVPNLLNVFMQLRKICNHPFLLNGVEEKELARAGSLEAYYKTFVDSSGKMVLLDKLLPKLKASGHKVLIFSQMVRVLDLLELYLKNKQYMYERLDGQVRRNERQASIDRFCKPGSDRFVFLLCTRAGGLGINLTAADTVIIYDSDWNPQNDIQAQARCHRIGQTQEVKVYRLITANSYERHMFERSSKKLGLDQAVLHDMGAPSQTASQDKEKDKEKKPTLDKKEIDDLLKYGAYDLFREENKEKERQFVEEDIDQILNRSSKVVWNEAQAKIAANSSFSKATFRSGNADPDIDINDPNFWNKVLPEARTAHKLLERLNKNVEALATKEKRTEFLHELETFVTDVVIAFREGKTEEASTTRNYLIKVFDILKGNLDSFSDDQQRRITRWQTEVTRFRRERRTTTRFGDTFENAYLGRGKDFFNGKDAWTESDRKKFHSLLFSLGPYRFKEVAKKCGVHRNFEEIREFTAEFLRQCIVHAEDKDRPYFIETLEIIFGPESLSEELDIQVDPRWSELLKRKLKAWIRNVKQILVLNEMFKGGVDNFEFPKVNKPLNSWWTAEEDRDLIIGVHKHGLGNYNEIKKDPSLCFVKHKAEIEAAEKAQKEQELKVEIIGRPETKSEVSEIKPETKQESPEIKSEPKPEPEIPSETKSETKPETQVKSETKSDTVSELKPEVAPPKSETSDVKMEDAPTTQEAPAEVKSEKAEEEEEYDDPYEFDEDDNKPPSSEPAVPVTPTKISTKLLIRLPTGWPSVRYLDNHVRYLLDFIRKSNAALDKAVAKQVREEERSFKRKRGKEDRERDWTKREQVDFRNVLMIYGAGPWDIIRTKANLHKTAEQTEEFFSVVIEQAKQMAAKQLGGKNQPLTKEDEDDEKDDIQVDGDEEVEKHVTPSRSSRAKTKEDLSRSSSAMQIVKIGGVEMRLAPISTTMARKLLKRVRLMEDVRTAQKSPDLDTKILKAKLFDMPPWWSPILDKVLLDAVVKFGVVFNDEWGLFLEEPDCVFFKNVPVGKPDAKQARQKFMKTFLMEKPLVSRLEYLCLIVLDSAQYAHSLYDLPTIVYSTRSYRGDGRKRKREDGDDDLMMDPDKIKMHGRVHLRDVPRDEDGKPMLPYQIKGATILSLGTIVHDKPAFHSRNYIWPAGFKSQRKMPSTKTHGEHVVYTSEILDGGTAPIFQVTPIDNPGAVMQHSTSSGVWCEMLKMIKKKSSVSVSGPEMFGFSDATIKMLIQELPNARLCTQYQWKDFEGGGEHPGSPGEQANESTPTQGKSVGHFDRATREKIELEENESSQSDTENNQQDD